MMSLTALVWIVVYMLLAAVVTGALWWLIGFTESQGLGPPVVFKFIRVAFVFIVVIGLCFFLISLISGQPLFRP